MSSYGEDIIRETFEKFGDAIGVQMQIPDAMIANLGAVLQAQIDLLAELQSTGRLVPPGGMALTAEQVTDVQILMASAHKSGIGANAADRLQGKFGSATLGSDSYSHRRTLGSVSGPGSAPTEPGPEVFSLTAEQVEEVRKLSQMDPWWSAEHVEEVQARVRAMLPSNAHVDDDLCPEVNVMNDQCVFLRGHDGHHRACGYKWLTAPAEPAEEVKPCGSNSIGLGWCKLTARHEGLHTNGTYLWGTPSEPDPPAPAEPAEEETKAETWIVQLPEGMTMEQWIESLPDEAPGLLAAVREVRERLGISSPVVPAPTETGPWA